MCTASVGYVGPTVLKTLRECVLDVLTFHLGTAITVRYSNVPAKKYNQLIQYSHNTHIRK